MSQDAVQPKNYPVKSPARQFVWDMLKAGRTPYHYNGRFCWEGPAVDIDEGESFQTVVRETKVTLQTDGMGLGLVVYPSVGSEYVGR